ncbi:MAG TPA: hypothetical protein VMJ10_29125 [Kofleriaceae bacterium]|nr:hypothetical protein [Kofleriaceae bacterium]
MRFDPIRRSAARRLPVRTASRIAWLALAAVAACAEQPLSTDGPTEYCYAHDGSLTGTASYVRQDAMGATPGVVAATFTLTVASDCTPSGAVGSACSLALSTEAEVEDDSGTDTNDTFALSAPACTLPIAGDVAQLVAVSGLLTVASQFGPVSDAPLQSAQLELSGQTQDAPPVVFRWDFAGTQ